MEHASPPPPAAPEPGIADLLRQLRDEAELLVRQEMKLARQETHEMVQHYVRAIVALAAGALVLDAALIIFLGTLSSALGSGLVAAGLSTAVTIWLAPLIIVLITGIIGWAMVSLGLRRLADSRTAAPRQTFNSLKEDQQWTQQKIKAALS